VLRFLAVEDDGCTNFPGENAAKTPHRELTAHFRDDILLLEKLLERNLTHWLTV
jgi:hypothetical protein